MALTSVNAHAPHARLLPVTALTETHAPTQARQGGRLRTWIKYVTYTYDIYARSPYPVSSCLAFMRLQFLNLRMAVLTMSERVRL